jgi:hypothetical protein
MRFFLKWKVVSQSSLIEGLSPLDEIEGLSPLDERWLRNVLEFKKKHRELF